MFDVNCFRKDSRAKKFNSKRNVKKYELNF